MMVNITNWISYFNFSGLKISFRLFKRNLYWYSKVKVWIYGYCLVPPPDWLHNRLISSEDYSLTWKSIHFLCFLCSILVATAVSMWLLSVVVDILLSVRSKNTKSHRKLVWYWETFHHSASAAPEKNTKTNSSCVRFEKELCLFKLCLAGGRTTNTAHISVWPRDKKILMVWQDRVETFLSEHKITNI